MQFIDVECRYLAAPDIPQADNPDLMKGAMLLWKTTATEGKFK